MGIIGTSIAQSVAGLNQAERTSSKELDKKERRDAASRYRRPATDDEVDLTEVEQVERTEPARSATDGERDNTGRGEGRPGHDAKSPDEGVSRPSIDLEA